MGFDGGSTSSVKGALCVGGHRVVWKHVMCEANALTNQGTVTKACNAWSIIAL